MRYTETGLANRRRTALAQACQSFTQRNKILILLRWIIGQTSMERYINLQHFSIAISGLSSTCFVALDIIPSMTGLFLQYFPCFFNFFGCFWCRSDCWFLFGKLLFDGGQNWPEKFGVSWYAPGVCCSIHFAVLT